MFYHCTEYNMYIENICKIKVEGYVIYTHMHMRHDTCEKTMYIKNMYNLRKIEVKVELLNQ